MPFARGYVVFSAVLLTLVCAQVAKADVLDGLLGWWPFDGDGTDASGNGFDLNLVGKPGFGPGRFGQALSLTGDVSQYAVRPGDDAAFNFGSSDLTVQIWANFNSHSREQTLIEKFSGCCGPPGWTFTTRNDLQFWPLITSGAVSYPTNEWHQYVARRSGDSVDLFIDGTNVVTGSFFRDLIDSPNPLLIGKRNSDDGRGFPVDGLLDDAAIWSRALSDDEIRSLHDAGFPLAAPKPFANGDPAR